VINRRTHLYLALFLLPWFLLYGISSIPFSHGQYFEELDKAKKLPLYTKVEERLNYAMPPTEDLKAFGDQIVKDTNLSGNYGAYRQGPNRIDVYIYTFWQSMQVKCFLDERRILVEKRRFRWDHFLTGMHAKGGFEQGGVSDAWAVLVDLTSVGMLLWVLTGLIMWWRIPSTRKWGWVALAAGFLTFALFIARL